MEHDKIIRYIDTMLERFKKDNFSWRYENGVVVLSAQYLYELTGNDKYLDYVITFYEKNLDSNGNIIGFNLEEQNIDHINPGKSLFKLYELTQNEKYRNTIEFIIEQLKVHPRTNKGNFWHKLIYPNQVWLDGLYMAQPFYMEYETKFNKFKNYRDILTQFINVRKFVFDDSKKLYYHGYDDSKEMFWCNKDTGWSKNFWIRAVGWYVMALVDTLEKMDNQMFYEYRQLISLLQETIDGLLMYQDETGLWYQVIDKQINAGNYLESSGSAMISYAILKAVRLEYLPKRYLKHGEKAFNGLCNTNLIEKENTFSLINCNEVSGLGGKQMRDGTYEYYIGEPIVVDEKKAVGAFIMAYTEMMKINSIGVV